MLERTRAARFWSKVDKTETCWLWTGKLDRVGYGDRTIGPGHDNAHRDFPHRIAYRLFVGPIPDGHEIDHLCRVRHCLRPDHLEVVTHAENMARGTWATAKTCRAGHPFSEENVYLDPKGRRICRACNRERNRRYRERLTSGAITAPPTWAAKGY